MRENERRAALPWLAQAHSRLCCTGGAQVDGDAEHVRPAVLLAACSLRQHTDEESFFQISWVNTIAAQLEPYKLGQYMCARCAGCLWLTPAATEPLVLHAQKCHFVQRREGHPALLHASQLAGCRGSQGSLRPAQPAARSGCPLGTQHMHCSHGVLRRFLCSSSTTSPVHRAQEGLTLPILLRLLRRCMSITRHLTSCLSPELCLSWTLPGH